ncbi:MAG TPA: PAS domain S-box protein, partial [Candidatus Sulfopaludibacter sp.]|nr:PAS domain S-box protein [Candidatus Sulfopaludibacter sp.]
MPGSMTSKLSRYALAIAAVLVAVGVRILLAPLLTTHAPLLLLTLSVMVAARFGGVGPGLLATGLSLVIGTYFFIAPYYSFRIANPADAVYLLLFLVVGVAISLLNGQLRRAFELSEEAAQRYHTLSEAVPQLVWTSAPDGSFDHLNARWAQFTGVPAARQLGFAWVEQIHPDDRAALLQRWTAAVNGSAEFRMEFRIRRQDGVHRWFDGRAAALRDAAGVVLKWFGSATDIHEAHEAREALRLEEERLKKIAETAPGVICSYRQRPDGTACFPYASPRIQDIYGRRPEDLAEDAGPIFKLMHPEDAGHVQATIAQSARTMMPWRDEFRVRNPERGEIWVEGHAQPARLADGSVEWYGFVADITARHQMEQALRNRTARLEELTRTLDLAHVIVRTLDGRITYWSQGAAAMYGWSFDEADGQPVRELLKTEFPAPWKEIESTLLAEGRWEGEMRQYRRDGTPVVVASYWALHRDHTGAPVSIIEVNNDISEQKRVEGELRDSELRLELA